MCFNSFPSFTIFLAMFIISIYYIPTSFCQGDAQYDACNRRFRCANFPIVDYPFWGGDRPSYCGHPAFKLNCQGDVSVMILQSRPYRVLGIDARSQLITVARQDLWNNTCPNSIYNTDLDYRVFSHPSGDQNLTLYYGCATVPGQQSPYEFECTVNGTSSDSYFYTQDALLSLNTSQSSCTVTIRVPINRTSAQLLTPATATQDDLKDVLKAGFGLKWKANDTECNACARSGGRCGYNSSTSSFACYCIDRPYQSLCNVPDLGLRNYGKTNEAQISKILGTVFVVVGIVIGCFIIHAYKKHKTLRAMEGEEYSNQNVEALVRNYEALTTQRYSYSDIKKMTHSFKEKIGQVGYGTVYKGKLADGRQVAVKVLTETKGNGEEFINEVASISRTSHVNVVTLLGFCYQRNKRALIYEFMPNKSLDKFIYDDERFPASNQRLDSNMLYQITVGIARGLEYLHRGCNTRIVHFDIKPQNILLDEDFCPKISDFGLAKLCKQKGSIISILGARGTAGYIAPEVFSRNFGGASHKSDVYSYGMMVLEMAGASKNNKSAVARSSELYFPDKIYENLENDSCLDDDGVSNNEEEREVKRKMTLVGLWCIQTIPADRPSMSKVVEMLEGSVQSLQIPPKPLLHSPTKSAQDSYTSLKLSSENDTESPVAMNTKTL
ncbi:LEAF RUST 10 DISEASE-RESISTANCE LOCUS RECEPTOR-LIKE PROTEIN KINASE-like 2.1 [Apium graveolens]|uniref:LEAF RUST 10 DISEASE-RESISTANCE LOCUS RECEPTOR-LIKE PROTEIN KINASE-like 2.1 n=1 Tax=Apium graveolens TaxID=4045 RepID=UPI003D799288